MTASFIFNDPLQPPKVMGIINLSQNSFYRKSWTSTESEAVRRAERMMEEGADIIDIGAESTRPGSKPISIQDELGLLLPVATQLRKNIPLPLSLDTYKPVVAEKVLELGFDLINDITGLRHPDMAKTIARFNAGVVVMHMLGTPETMQENINYNDCVKEVREFLAQAVCTAESAGIAPGRILIDPGIGFGKDVEHNLQLIARLDEFKSLNKPILLGVSRKSFIGKVLNVPVDERLEGSLAAVLMGMVKGAQIFRVHDVQATVRAVRMAHAIRRMEP